jgi:GDP-4-dehydro-6-deoxy-D-mannose reductase
VSVRHLLELLLERTSEELEVRADPSRRRGTDIQALVGSHERLTRATGWEPEIPLARTLADLLDWWRAELASGRPPE